jgi:hypothetical protein
VTAFKIRYLETAAHGLSWMRKYYKDNPQLNLIAASASLKQAERVLTDFPLSGETYEDYERVREYHLQGTPFSLLYSVSGETIWIIDIRDMRGNRSASALREFVRTTRNKKRL